MRRKTLHTPSSVGLSKLTAMPISWFVILTLYHLGVHGKALFNSPVIQNVCPALESCEHAGATLKEKNCACDELCVTYGDCCIDAPGVEAKYTQLEYSCLEIKQIGGVFIKDYCSPTYAGPAEVKSLCEDTDIDDQTDPIGSLPVTDSVTGITYKNYYCNICNDITNNTVLWSTKLECPSVPKSIDKKYIFQNLASVGSRWGVNLTIDNGSKVFHDCEVDRVRPPFLESKIRLCKPGLISTCPPEWEDFEVKVMCRSYMAAKCVHGGGRYRNAHCALCHNVSLEHTSCLPAEGLNYRQFETHAFSLLLDVNEGKGEEVGLINKCPHGEVFDPFFKKCRSLSCLPGYVKKKNGCVQTVEELTTTSSISEAPVLPEPLEVEREEKAYNTLNTYKPVLDISDNIRLKPQKLSGTSYNLSIINDTNLEEIKKFQNCLLISLAGDDYTLLPNESIYVPKYNKVYKPTSYHSADGSILVCSHLTSEKDPKFMPSMGYMTVIGLTISMICLFMHFVAFWCIPDLQNLSGKSLVSQCASLFFAYLCFMIGLSGSLGYTGCSIMSFLTFYFFQVSFFWMAVMAYDVWRTLRKATTELRVSNGKQLGRFVSYSLFTWTVPFFIVISIAFAEFTNVFPVMYRPGFASPRCWFKRRRSLLVFFVSPLIAIMVSNLVLFVSSSRMILLTTQTSVKQHNQTNRRNFKLYLRLALLMGLTWIIGLIAGFADVEFLWYLFVVLNTLQGLFIFIAFTCSVKVCNFVKNKLQIKKSFQFRSSSNSVSTGSARTNSTNLHMNLAKMFSSKQLIMKSDSSLTNSTVSTCSSDQSISPM